MPCARVVVVVAVVVMCYICIGFVRRCGQREMPWNDDDDDMDSNSDDVQDQASFDAVALGKNDPRRSHFDVVHRFSRLPGVHIPGTWACVGWDREALR